MSFFLDWVGPRLDRQLEIHVLRRVAYCEDGDVAPLANLLRSDPASRLFLWCVFVQALSADPVRVPARELTAPLGLATVPRRRGETAEHPEIRTVHRAVTTIVTNGLATSSPGFLPALTKMFGCGFRLDTHEDHAVASHRSGHGWHHRRDLAVPATFWTRGWITWLSAMELAALFALLAERADKRAITMRAGKVRREYGMSDDSWHRARARLEDLGLVEREVLPGRKQSYVYRLQKSVLLHDPQ